MIILYGGIGNSSHPKTQNLIDGKLTCGYREYARHGGVIVYMSPQRIKESWEKVITNPKDIIEFCNVRPNEIVWSVKRDNSKDIVLKNISNFKIHYSCNALNTYDPYCNISLVDTPERIKVNCHRLLVKGKDSLFWTPVHNKKQFDYLLMGKRADKNQIYFINLLNQIKEPRSILWIGGKAFGKKFKSRHKVVLTDVGGPEFVRDNISRAKVGILYSEHPTEGFPQSFLEMTMCGVPVVYGGPKNDKYFCDANSMLPKKENLLSAGERLLKHHDSKACRQAAIERYSIEKSIKLLESYR